MSAAGENKRQKFNYLAYDTVLQLLVFVLLLLFICCMGEQCQKLFLFWWFMSPSKLFCRRHRNISVSHYGLVEKQSLSNSFCLPCLLRRRVGPRVAERRSQKPETSVVQTNFFDFALFVCMKLSFSFACFGWLVDGFRCWIFSVLINTFHSAMIKYEN